MLSEASAYINIPCSFGVLVSNRKLFFSLVLEWRKNFATSFAAFKENPIANVVGCGSRLEYITFLC